MQLVPLQRGKRSGHVAVAQGGYMWVWGGSRGRNSFLAPVDAGLYRVKLPSQPGTAGLDAWWGAVQVDMDA
jgi:hypothetical protein